MNISARFYTHSTGTTVAQSAGLQDRYACDGRMPVEIDPKGATNGIEVLVLGGLA